MGGSLMAGSSYAIAPEPGRSHFQHEGAQGAPGLEEASEGKAAFTELLLGVTRRSLHVALGGPILRAGSGAFAPPYARY